ncbi:MAG: hypothetical protein ACM3NW_12470, partial [Syntrophomonadaceae bacterium]
ARGDLEAIMPASKFSRSSLLAFVKSLALMVAAFAFSALPLSAQERQERPPAPPPQAPPHAAAPQRYIPPHGPAAAAPHREAAPSQPAEARGGEHGHAHRVNPDGDVWEGHEDRDDARFHVEHAWPHGHFEGGFGPNHVFRLHGGGPARFWIGGGWFAIAPFEVGDCGEWLWDADEVVLYDDLDHPGWYLAYNVRLGTYCHVSYLGPG